MADNFLEDPFFKQNLNPYFLFGLQQFALSLDQAILNEAQKNEAKLNILKFVFRRFFQPLYSNAKPQIKGTVYFFSRIYFDGWGDYFSLLKSVKIFKEYYPDLDVKLVYTFQRHLPKIDTNDFHIHENEIFSFSEFTLPSYNILESIFKGNIPHFIENDILLLEKEKDNFQKEYHDILEAKGIEIESLKEHASYLEKEIEMHKVAKKGLEIYEGLKQSLAIIHIALAINTFDNPLVASKSLYFAEAGNFLGISNSLSRNWFSMGISPFDEGIFLNEDKNILETSWENTTLSKILWGITQPNNEQCDYFLDRTSLHLGYFTRLPEQLKVYIYLTCLLQKNKTKNIDIILPGKYRDEMLNINTEWLNKNGIQKAISIDINSGHEQIIYEKKDDPGKILRLIHALPLPANDFKKILHLSGQIVACTGDLSMAECLSAKKLPFYELRKHKAETPQSFYYLSKFLNLNHIAEYFSEMQDFQGKTAEEAAKTLYSILNNPSFSEQWEKFLKFINQFYTFENSLLLHLNRHFWHYLRPELISKEEKIIIDYSKNKISAQVAYESLEKELKAIS